MNTVASVTQKVSPLNLIGRAWRGEERAWVVFWLYWVLPELPLKFVDDSIFDEVNLIFRITFALVFIAYLVWVLVAMWRCQKNAKSRWALFMRPIVILSIAALLGLGYDALTSD